MSARTAVIYARFSCSKQREASIEDQLRVCEEWCAREGYTVVNRYCDYAMSGRTDDRPQFQEMIANAGESDIVLVYMMDRFSRDIYDAPIYKKRLRDKNVKVVSATEAVPDGPEAMLIESMYEAMAAMESAHTAQRVKRGMDGNAMKCLHNGVAVFGYSHGADGRFEVNEQEAELVREAFTRKISGEPVNSIARDFARRGVKSRNGKATYGFVHTMLNNEKYTGVYTWGDIRIEGGMPAIVSKEDYLMAKMTKPKKQRANELWSDFPLTGKAICGECGMNLAGTSGRGRQGKKYRYYNCKCGAKPVRADWLESAIVDALRELLSDREEALKIAKAIEPYMRDENAIRRAKEARKRKRAAEKGIDNITDAIAEGLDYATVKDKLEELKVQAEVAAAELKVHESAATFDAEDFADFLQFGATLSDEALIPAFVFQVMVEEEDVLVTLNYDVKKSEPARLRIPRVRTVSTWWALQDSNLQPRDYESPAPPLS